MVFVTQFKFTLKTHKLPSIHTAGPVSEHGNEFVMHKLKHFTLSPKREMQVRSGAFSGVFYETLNVSV